MIEETLYDLVVQARFNKNEAVLALYEYFKTTLEKYARKLRSEDGRQDLIVAFLELIPHIPLSEKCCSDNQIAAYIRTSIYHEFIKLSMRSVKQKEYEFAVDFNEENSIGNSTTITIIDDNIVEQISWLDVLTDKQKNIIFLHYFLGYSIKEIADSLDISRQAANKIKNAALKNLEKYYD